MEKCLRCGEIIVDTKDCIFEEYCVDCNKIVDAELEELTYLPF